MFLIVCDPLSHRRYFARRDGTPETRRECHHRARKSLGEYEIGRTPPAAGRALRRGIGRRENIISCFHPTDIFWRENRNAFASRQHLRLYFGINRLPRERLGAHARIDEKYDRNDSFLRADGRRKIYDSLHSFRYYQYAGCKHLNNRGPYRVSNGAHKSNAGAPRNRLHIRERLALT